MIFGLLFLVDGLMQCIAAYVVRYARWRYVFASGVAEILLAIFFFSALSHALRGHRAVLRGPVPGLLRLQAAGACTPRPHAGANPGLVVNARPDFMPTASAGPAQTVFDGPPLESERALTVHVWTPSGSAKAQTRNYLMLNCYIAAVDVNGVISTGHAALESPEGVYVSLYPAQEIDRSPEQFGAAARHGRERRAGRVPARLRHGSAGLVSVHHAGAHPQLRRGKVAGVLGRLPAGCHLQPDASQLFQLGIARAGGGAGRRGRPAAWSAGRLARAAAVAADAGIVGGLADPQARTDHGLDAGPDAGLRARAQHAGRPPAVRLVADVAGRAALDQAAARGLAQPGPGSPGAQRAEAPSSQGAQ